VAFHFCPFFQPTTRLIPIICGVPASRPYGTPCGFEGPRILAVSSANRKLANTGLLLGKKNRPSGRILRVAEIAQADANQTKPLVRAEADTFPQ
jgi:hypothetical protein